MDFRLLGPLEVSEHGRPLALGGMKQRSVLAVLLMHANELVTPDQLIDRIWGAAPPRRASKNVQVYVSRLRKLVGADPQSTHPRGDHHPLDPGEHDH